MSRGVSPAVLYRRLRSAGAEDGDNDDIRVKKVVLLFTCGLMIAAAGIWLALYKMLGLPVSASLPFAFQLASLATLLIYLWTLNFSMFRAVQLGLFLFVPFVVQWSIGNFVSASGVILWGLLAPVGAVLLYSARESIPWFFAYIVLLLLTGYVDYDLAAMPPRGPQCRHHHRRILRAQLRRHVGAGVFAPALRLCRARQGTRAPGTRACPAEERAGKIRAPAAQRAARAGG